MKLKSIDAIIAERDAILQEKPDIDSAKKYIFAKTENRHDLRLYRIKAIRDIPKFSIKKGDLGGLVQTPLNLSQDGDCWLDEESKIIGNARVSGDAFIKESIVQDDAKISGGGRITNSEILNAAVIDNAACINDSRVCDDATILDSAVVKDSDLHNKTKVSGKVNITRSSLQDSCIVSGQSKVIDSTVKNNAKISNKAFVQNSVISDSSTISGSAAIVNSAVKNAAKIRDKAFVRDSVILDSSIVRDSAIIANRATVKGASVIGNDVRIAQPIIIPNWKLESTSDISILPCVPVVYFAKSKIERCVSKRISVLVNDRDYVDRSWFAAEGKFVGHIEIRYNEFDHLYCGIYGAVNEKTNELSVNIVELRNLSWRYSNHCPIKYSPCTEDPSFIKFIDHVDWQPLSMLQKNAAEQQITFIKQNYTNESRKLDTYFGANIHECDFIWKYGQAVNDKVKKNKEEDNLSCTPIASFSGSIKESAEWLYKWLDTPERDYELSVDYYMRIVKEHNKN